MKQFFKNKFFYIMTVLTLLLTILPMVYINMGVTFVFRDAVNILLTPMQKVFHAVGNAVDGFTGYFYRFDALVEENTKLKAEVAELQAQIYDNKEMEEMYAWMSNFLEMKRQHIDYTMTCATITGRQSGNYSKTLTLDIGSGAGISTGMPVVDPSGIIGQVTEVGYNWATVTTLVDPQSSIGVYVERTGASGIAEGDIQLGDDGYLKLLYLDDETKIEVGDRILSRGTGSVYPRGLVVGYVRSIETDPFSRSKVAYVQCAVSASDLVQVMIITDFELQTEIPGAKDDAAEATP